MNELITVKDDGARQFVAARELYVSLGVARDFSTWIKDRIEKYGFIEGADFSPELGESSGGRPGIEYNLSLEMAKELAMVENNDKGREVRRYLISLEKAWNNPEMVMARALQCSPRFISMMALRKSSSRTWLFLINCARKKKRLQTLQNHSIIA